MVAIHSDGKCHMLVALGWLLPHHPCGDPPWCHVAQAHGAMWHHVKCHSTPRASKSMKFLLSHNPTKFDRVARFCEMIPTVKSVSSSEISKNFRFSCIIPTKLLFCPFQFYWVLHCLPNIRIVKLVAFRVHIKTNEDVLQAFIIQLVALLG